MRFQQIDKITELVPGQRIRATRTLRADEDYLRDHFPAFPVMPGVLMLEALFQAGCWLVRASDQFESTLIWLAEVKNAKFADFVEPEQTLTVEVDWVKREGDRVTLKATGKKGDQTAVSARLLLRTSTLAQQEGFPEDVDQRARWTLKEKLVEYQS